MRITIIAFSLLTLFAGHTLAQSTNRLESVFQSLDNALSDLDSNKITTGYLIDKSVDLVNLSIHNGESLSDSNYVNVFLFRDLLRMFDQAGFGRQTQAYDPDGIYSSITTAAQGTVKLCSALFKYEYIVGNALEDNLITYNQESGKFTDNYINGLWQNPYETKYVFMFTSGTLSSDSTNVIYDLSLLNTIGNVSSVSYEIDFGNGTGYIPLGTLTNYQVSYNSAGVKELKMRVILPDNSLVVSHTFLSIQEDQALPSSSSGEMISYDDFYTMSKDGATVRCYAKYNDFHSGVALRPFIYIEGFDSPVLAELARFSEQSFNKIIKDECADNYTFYNGFTRFQGYQSGYDYFYVDWEKPEADIKTNAALLEYVLQWINSKKPSDGSGGRGVIFAHSMGGLIACWALKQMEQSGINHEIDYLVTQDTPYLGAVVPIGLQYAIRDAYRFLLGENGNGGIGINNDLKTVINKIVSILDSSSARQMMCNYVNQFGVIDNSAHSVWQNDFADIGLPNGDFGYPMNHLAISSGGELGHGDLDETIFRGFFRLFCFIYIIANIDIRRDSYVGALVSRTTFSFAPCSLLFPIQMLFTAQQQEHYSDINTGQMDVKRGSYLSFNDSHLGINVPLAFSLFYDICSKVLFIPSGSSLYVNNNVTDFYTYPLLLDGSCPITSYCLERDAQRHDTNEGFYYSWLFTHKNVRINVPTLVSTGDYVSVLNTSSLFNESLQCSDNSILIINANNQVFVNGLGFADIVYSANSTHTVFPSDTVLFNTHNLYGKIVKKVKVLTGFPDMVLSYSLLEGNNCCISANCTIEHQFMQSAIDELAASKSVKYVWGRKNGTESITWSDTTNVNCFYCSATSQAVTRVYMKLVTKEGLESTVNYIDINRVASEPFLFNPLYYSVTLNNVYGNYTQITNMTYTFGKFFCVWANSDYPSQVSVPDSIRIGNETLNLHSCFNSTINNESKTIYCFNIQNSATYQNTVSLIRQGLTGERIIAEGLLFIDICSGSDTLQTVILSVFLNDSEPEIPILPFG